MALDKLVDSTQLDSDLTSVANAIRAKSGGSGQLAFPADFLTEIASISGGGGESMNVQHFSYTHATDWFSPVSASAGSTKAFADTYFNEGEGLYWAFLTDNTASSTYRGRAAWKANNVGATARGYCRPVNWVNTETGDGWFLIAAGTKIDVFFIPKSAF